MRWRVCILLATLSLVLTGCTRRTESAGKDGPPPKLTTLDLSPDGEILPPPSDVAISKSSSGAATPAQDQTLVLLAKMAQQQDSIQGKLEKVDERTGIFLPAVEAHTRQLQQLQDETLPKLTQKVTTATEQLSEKAQNLEKRLEAVEAALSGTVPLNLNRVTQTIAVPQPQHKPLISDVPKEVPETTASVKTADTKPEPKQAPVLIKAPKWTPYAQQLRDQVRGAYEKVIQEFPNSPEAADACMGLAGMYEEEENWPEAIAAYERLIKEFPKSPSAIEAQFRLAGALASKGAWDEARKAYLLAADTFPRHALATPALLSAADCYAQQNKIADALREYKAIERAQQGSAFAQSAKTRIADLLFKEKRFPEAIEAYKAAIQDSAEERKVDLELQLALSELSAGKYEAARATLNALLPRANNEALGWTVRLHLARAFEEEEKPLDAARAFAQLAEKYPKSPGVLEARLHAAHAFLSAELADHAAEQINAVLRNMESASPEMRQKIEPQALFTAARAARQAGDSAKVKEHLSALRERHPDHTLVLDADLEEANTLVAAGRTDDAIALLRQVVRRHPSSPRATAVVMRIAELQERSGNPSKGIRVYSELLNTSSDAEQSAHYKLRRGLLLQEVGRDEEAGSIFQALINDVNTPKAIASLARYQRALVDQRGGRLAEAIGGYEKFLEEGAGSTPLTGVDLTGLLDDARWKVSKLKWLTTQEPKKDSEKPRLPVQAVKSKAQAL